MKVKDVRPARCPPASSILAQGDPTAWLSMQSEAKRSRGPLLPAICDLQGDFQKLQGEPVLRYEIHQFLQWLMRYTYFCGAGSIFAICREEQREIAKCSRVDWHRFQSHSLTPRRRPGRRDRCVRTRHAQSRCTHRALATMRRQSMHPDQTLLGQAGELLRPPASLNTHRHQGHWFRAFPKLVN
jgi:hypothetical protein